MTMMRLRGEFFLQFERLQSAAMNDNCLGDEGFAVRNLVTTELTYTLARFTRDDGAP